jgi:hypothetical protein
MFVNDIIAFNFMAAGKQTAHNSMSLWCELFAFGSMMT